MDREQHRQERRAGRRERASGGTEQVKEHLRAAKDAASDAVRGTTRRPKSWTRDQYSGLQERVEAEPYRAAAWALGIGFLAGVLITALAALRAPIAHTVQLTARRPRPSLLGEARGAVRPREARAFADSGAVGRPYRGRLRRRAFTR